MELKLSESNTRLKPNETSRFLIWSIPPEVTCPGKTELCTEKCYARKTHSRYPRLRTKLSDNWQESKKETFVNGMRVKISESLTNVSEAKKKKKLYFRIHESGDFYNLEYLEKWIEIASKSPNVTFLAYTKSVQLVEQVGAIPSNLVIRYSVWPDTKPEELKIALRLNLPIYEVFEKSVLDHKIKTQGYTKCDMDCQVCKKCYTSDIPKIAVAIS